MLSMFSMGAMTGRSCCTSASSSAFWLKVASSVLALMATTLIAMLLRAVSTSRHFVSLSKRPVRVLGRPLFFPVTVNHMRQHPATDRFRNQILLVGIPIGASGHLGNLLSIANKSKSGRPWSAWFHFDSSRYLYRGDEDLTLREKLDQFIESQVKLPFVYHPFCLHIRLLVRRPF